MKKYLLLSLLILVSQICIFNICYSQWQSDVRICNDTGVSNTSFNSCRNIVASNDTVIVFWYSQYNGWWYLFSKSSFDGGYTWLDSVKIKGSPLIHYTNPSACYSNGRFYVAYASHNTNVNVYYISAEFSTDGGMTWSERNVFTSDSFIKDKPTIAADSNYVYVACWVYISPSSNVIKYKRSTNFGLSYGDEYSWSTVSTIPDNPSITCSGSNVMVAYQESSTGKYDIVYCRSTNYGLGWGGFQTIATGSENRGFPSIASSGSYVYIFWDDSKYGNYDILARRSTDMGLTWIGETRLTSHASNQRRPDVTANGTNVHAVWEDYRDSTEIYYLAGVNYGGTWQTVQRLTDNPYSSMKPSIIVSGQKLHVCWSDRRSGNYDVYYKKNPTGNAIGIQKISSEIPQNYSLSQNYPNPFNPTTKIKFDIPSNVKGQMSNVKITFFDVLGKEVTKLVNEQLKPGSYEIEFNGSNYTSGLYFYELSVGDFRETKKMVMVK